MPIVRFLSRMLTAGAAIFVFSSTHALADQCTLTFNRGAGPDLISLTFEVDYSASGATPAGEFLPECEAAGVPLTVVGFELSEGVLTVQVNGLEFLITAGDIATCVFDVGDGETVTAGDFGVTATEAADASLQSVTPPAVTISDVSCGAPATTTTTTTIFVTTTSMPFSSTTSTSMIPSECTVVLDYDDTLAVGGFNLDLDYSSVGSGRFALIQGTLTPDCVVAAPRDFDDFGFNDNTLLNELTVSFAASESNETLDTPGEEVVRCTFLPDESGAQPTVDDFVPVVSLALGPGGSPLSGTPEFVVSDVSCTGNFGTTTTSTTMPGGSTTCGDPVDPGALGASFTLPSVVTASDALLALNAAVSLASCELCVCDVDNSGAVTAADALRILTAAVGGDVTLDCPPCGG